jgi:hypothetical protein
MFGPGSPGPTRAPPGERAPIPPLPPAAVQAWGPARRTAAQSARARARARRAARATAAGRLSATAPPCRAGGGARGPRRRRQRATATRSTHPRALPQLTRGPTNPTPAHPPEPALSLGEAAAAAGVTVRTAAAATERAVPGPARTGGRSRLGRPPGVDSDGPQPEDRRGGPRGGHRKLGPGGGYRLRCAGPTLRASRAAPRGRSRAAAARRRPQKPSAEGAGRVRARGEGGRL